MRAGIPLCSMWKAFHGTISSTALCTIPLEAAVWLCGHQTKPFWVFETPAR